MKKDFLRRLNSVQFAPFLFLLMGVFCCSVVKAQNLDDLIVDLESATTTEQKNRSRKNLALYYEKNRIYPKAIEYYQKIYQTRRLNDSEEKEILNTIASLQLATNNYTEAEKTYQSLLSISKQDEQATIYNHLSELYRKKGDTNKALEYAVLSLSFYKEDSPTHAVLLNNVGFLHKKVAKNQEAGTYFQRALDMNKRLIEMDKSLTARDKNALYINMATNLVYLKDIDLAISKLKENIVLQEKSNNRSELVSSLNFLAASYLVNGNTIDAAEELQQAIRLGEFLQDNELQAESYKVLSELYNVENNFQAAQEAYKKSQSFIEKSQKIEEQKKQVLIDKEIEAEKEESSIQKQISEKKEQELTFQQLKLESEKREQELVFLEQQKQLQAAEIKSFRLAKERTQQALAITQQKLETEQKNQALRALQVEKELQDRELIQQRLEKRESEKTVELLEAEKEIER